MRLYEITTDDGTGCATYLTRRRADAFEHWIYKTVYEVASYYALRDRPAAWSALHKLLEAHTFREVGASRTFKLGATTITATVTL